MSTTLLDANQVIKAVYDETTQSLNTNATLVASDITIVVEINEASDSIQIFGNDGSANKAIKTDSNGELQVDVLSSALPTGAATSALQTTGNTSLSSIDTKLTTTNTSLSSIKINTDNLDTTLSSRATEVTLLTRASEATLSTLNSKFVSGTDIGDITINNASGASAVNIQDGGNSITVDGTVTANQGTSPWVISGTVAATQSGSWTTGRTWTLSSGSDSIASVQSGVWTNTVTQATGTNLHTVVDSGTITTITNVVHVDDNGSSLTVDNAGTFAVQAAQSGTWNITNISGTISLPTGASTAALQTQPGVDIGDVTINNAAGAAAVNIQDGGNSITIDGTIAATQSGTWNITNVSGTVSLPTGASTAALQTTGNTSLSSIDGKLNSLGQKTMANSVPVVLASDQTQNRNTASGTITGTSAVEIDCTGYGTVIATIQDPIVSGWTGEIGFYYTSDGSTWEVLSGNNLNLYNGDLPILVNAIDIINNQTAFGFNASGYKKIRLIGQSVVGNAAITMIASPSAAIIEAVRSTVYTVADIRGSGTLLTSTLISAKQSLDVNVANTTLPLPTDAATETTLALVKTSVQLIDDAIYTDGSGTPSKAIGIAGTDGTNPQIIKTDAAGELQVDVLTLPVGHNIIDSGTLTTVSTVTSLTQMNGVAISMNTGVRDTGTQRVTIATNDVVPTSQSGTWTNTVTQATGTNLHTVIDSGTVTTVSTVTSLTQMNGAAISMGTGVRDAGTQRVTIATNDVVPASQSGAWSVTATQATGTNLHVVTDSGTITTVSTVTNLSQLGGAAISMNTGVRDTGTQRVTIATNDVVPSAQSGTWNITNVSGTVSLPTGASTETTLNTILTKYFSDTSTLSNVSSSATNVTLLASNASRKGFNLYNDSTQLAYVKFGSTATTSSFTVKMQPSSYYENPLVCYRGIIDALWDSANGSMRITELT